MQNEWISVKDRLPKKDGEYLCITGAKHYRLLYFAGNLYEVDKYEFYDKRKAKNKSGFYYLDNEWGYVEWDDITHWMPLPKLPKGE